MAKKGAKATAKFAKSGELKRTIDARRKHQKVKKQVQLRKSRRGAPKTDHDDELVPDARSKGKGKGREKQIDVLDGSDDEGADDDDDDGAGPSASKKLGKMSVDDLLDGKFMEGEDDDDAEDGDGDSDNESFASLDDLEDEEAAHKLELSALAAKDPEFYKYLQQNDKELLNFGASGATAAINDDDESDDGGFEVDGDAAMSGSDDDEEDEETPILTSVILREWQKSLLETRSLRALRKLLVAFRSAAKMNEDDEESTGAWTIDDPAVFNKLVVTTLKYTPVVLEHHAPYKTLPNGKYKSPTQSAKVKSLQKLTLSYFLAVIRLVSHLTDADMQHLAITESTRIIPYIVGSRKAVKAHLKMCLGLWSSGEDKVRVAAYLALRKLAFASDESIIDLVLKGTYMTLVRSSKNTSVHTLPSLTLLKNTAAELYTLDPGAAYQHAFGYIRQLAVHLRNSMKVKSKEAYRQVYNWQFVHSVDFWADVLAKACDKEAEEGGESELRPLIYPLIQVTLGAIRLIPTPRYHPLHLHLIRSLLHLSTHTKTYVPLAPLLLPIITSTTSPTSRPKASTLRPLDLSIHIRAPAQYLKTRVLAEGICDEAVFLLGSWAEGVHSSVAFPEIMLPVVVVLKKCVKRANGGKGVVQAKTLVERIEDGVKWVGSRRENVGFAPGERNEVERWEGNVKVEETPLGKWMRVVRKAREKKAALADKARDGEDEILDEE